MVFKFHGGASQLITSSKPLYACLMGGVAILLLEVLQQSHEFAIYKKYNWQCAGTALAICTAQVEGHRVG